MKITAKVLNVFPIESTPTANGGQFQKRIVWAIDDSNSQYPRYLPFQFAGQALNLPDRLQPGMTVEFDYDIDGRMYNKDGKSNIFISLRSWNFNILAAAPPQGYNPQQPQAPPQQPAYGQQQQVPPSAYGQPQQTQMVFGQQQQAPPQGYGQQPTYGQQQQVPPPVYGQQQIPAATWPPPVTAPTRNPDDLPF